MPRRITTKLSPVSPTRLRCETPEERMRLAASGLDIAAIASACATPCVPAGASQSTTDETATTLPTPGASTDGVTLIPSVGATELEELEWEEAGLAANTTYYYRVGTSFLNSEVRFWSSAVSITTQMEDDDLLANDSKQEIDAQLARCMDESELEDDSCSAVTLIALNKNQSSVPFVLTERSDKAEDERPEIEAPKQAPRVRGNSSNNGGARNRRARGNSSWLRRCSLIFGLLCVVFATIQICADIRQNARPNYFVSNNATDATKPNENIAPITGRELDLANSVADRAQEASSEDNVESILFDDNDELATNEPTIAEKIRKELKSKAIEIKETAYQKTYVERPVAIEKIKIGDRTAGVNPRGSEPCDESRLAVEPHLVYSLKLPKEDGSFCDIQILRPSNWLASSPVRLCNEKTQEPLTELDYILAEMNPISCHIDAVAEVWLDLPEMGCIGWAQLTEVSYDFEYRPGKGNLVTGIFQHEVSEAVDLYVEGQDEPIGVTETHPFWSVDRQDFVPVSELREGERLLVLNGETKRAVQKLPRPGPEKVYNLEIFGEHVYRVSEDGVLVHNSRACGFEVDIITNQIPGLRKVNGCLVFVFEERPDIPVIMGPQKNVSRLLRDNGLTKSNSVLMFEAHHIPSRSFNELIGRLSHEKGISISLPHDAHALTRTYGKHVCSAKSALSSLKGDLDSLSFVLWLMGFKESSITQVTDAMYILNILRGGIFK